MRQVLETGDAVTATVLGLFTKLAAEHWADLFVQVTDAANDWPVWLAQEHRRILRGGEEGEGQDRGKGALWGCPAITSSLF